VSRVSCEIGLMLRPGKGWVAGVHLVNPVPVRIRHGSPETLPRILRAGLSWSYPSQFLVSVEAEKELLQPLRIKAGMEYLFLHRFALRCGACTAPFEVTFGAGYFPGRWNVDLGCSYHFALGYSPQVAVSYRYGK
jgi:hypothetical protein